MKKNLPIIVTLVLFCLNFVYASELLLNYNSDLEKENFKQWAKDKTFETDIVTAMLVSEGITDSSDINEFKLTLASVHNNLKSKIKDKYSPSKKTKIILKYLHKNILHEYKKIAELNDILNHGYYNDLTGVCIFYYLANSFAVDVQLIVDKSRIICQVNDNKKIIPVNITPSQDNIVLSKEQQESLNQLLDNNLITTTQYNEMRKNINSYILTNNRRIIDIEEVIGYHYFYLGNSALEIDDQLTAINNFEKAICIVSVENIETSLYSISLIHILVNELFSIKDKTNHLINALLLDQNNFEQLHLYHSLFGGHIILSLNQQDYTTLINAIDEIEKYLPNDDIIINEHTVIKNKIYYHKAGTSYNRGNYLQALEISKMVLDQYPEDQLFNDLYVESSLSYAREMESIGESKVAMELVKPLISDYPEYEKIPDIYINICLSYLYRNKIYDYNPKEAVKILNELHTLDPVKVVIHQCLSLAYNKIAMNHFKNQELEEAEQYILKALNYTPKDLSLKNKLEEIRRINKN